MADADGSAGVGSTATGRVREVLPRRRLLLAFVGFLLLFGQPALIFALALTAPSVVSLAVIVVGTAVLAGPAARAYLGQGWSVSRLADYVLAVGLVQIGLVVVSRVTHAGGASPAIQPGIVLVSYPVVFVVLTRLVWD